VNDIWVCDTCKSINRRRDDVCYRCRAQRSGAIEAPGLDLRAESAAAERGIHTYVTSWPLALVTVVLLVAVAILGIVILRLQAADYPTMRQAFVDALTSGRDTVDQAFTTQSVQLGLASTVRTGLALLALLCFAGWLALVTRNAPLLGGGTPSRSPVRVFAYALIPIWNLIKVPGILQDLLYRVDTEGGGAFMVLAAWIGLVGSYLVSILGTWMITWAGIRELIPQFQAGDLDSVVKTFGDILDQSFWLGVVVALMVVSGTFLLAAIMIRVESRCAARDSEIRAQMSASGAPTPAAGPSWQGSTRSIDPPAPAIPAGATIAPASRGLAQPSTPSEPNWPAGRPWPGAPRADGSHAQGPELVETVPHNGPTSHETAAHSAPPATSPMPTPVPTPAAPPPPPAASSSLGRAAADPAIPLPPPPPPVPHQG
jgi:hypothetical protein